MMQDQECEKKTTLDTFVALVHEMRQAQNEYFHYRTQKNLTAAINLERQVDAYILRYSNGDVPAVQLSFGG